MTQTPPAKKTNVFRSAVAAMLGVQSDQNRHQDFNQPSALPFIVAGLVVIVIFVAVLIGISQFVAG
ncbi:DUF2970 domain-containing protein [Photobacterium galatheae]|uniref:DUF2970 domain-containing protein n=1 Tax=Photobacterium galatheae TaxID=1654360 RepID=A0A066RSC9_9GAMM|nr:DUF2970 domain-containing protein [Photobacterium galatheae]KDM90597.1 hypothetical protein EA58_15915 [Photobacterium galatheae]MCM0150710.1 DUF2970 domain-containing protein [Photobacterium galatheae]